jgi:hypothetical protein
MPIAQGLARAAERTHPAIGEPIRHDMAELHSEREPAER